MNDFKSEISSTFQKIIPVEEGRRHGVELYYINPSMVTDSIPVLLAMTNEKSFLDFVVYAAGFV